MARPLALLVVFLMAGCATASGVVSISPNTYVVSRQAATGFSGMGNLRVRALQEAGQTCTRMGKSLRSPAAGFLGLAVLKAAAVLLRLHVYRLQRYAAAHLIKQRLKLRVSPRQLLQLAHSRLAVGRSDAAV